MSTIEPSAADKQLAAERDSFFKMALVACAANFFAINNEFAPDAISAKAARMARHLWVEVEKFRSEHAK